MKIKEKLKANKFAAGVMEDYDFKTKTFALLSFVLTVAFACVNLAGAVIYRLVWYGALAGYYFVLIVFRGGILLANRKCAKKFAENGGEYEICKWKIYLGSGAFLIVFEIAMVGAVTQMMLSERPVQSGHIMAIANAAYTFYKIITSIYNLVKSRKFSSPVTQSLRSINFADSCMSVVSLTVLMVSTFEGEAPSADMQLMKYIVGFAGCAVIILTAALMLVRAHKKIKFLKAEGESANG